MGGEIKDPVQVKRKGSFLAHQQPPILGFLLLPALRLREFSPLLLSSGGAVVFVFSL
jgi:hypothetical protein